MILSSHAQQIMYRHILPMKGKTCSSYNRMREQKKENDFENIEGFMSALISHESVHVVITKLVNNQISDSLDDVEIIIERFGKKFQVSLNNMFFSTDFSGIITS